MNILKLSQLPDETVLASHAIPGVMTAKELKDEILNHGYVVKGKWYTTIKKEWNPDARFMIETYIDSEYDQMYEDWDERAKDCITDELVSKIQILLDKAFQGEAVKNYWEWDEVIEIDVEPANEVR